MRLRTPERDFILAVGDDTTDEDTFAVLPEDSYTVKVGFGDTNAKFHVNSFKDVRDLLKKVKS